MSRNNKDRRNKPKNNQHWKNNNSKKYRITHALSQWQPDCPICGKTVRNLNIAIEEKTSKQPAHFECVMQKIAEEVHLGPQERLHYLGSGCFGVVKLEEGKGLSSFTIIKRIPYEEHDNKADWRKKIFQYVNN